MNEVAILKQTEEHIKSKFTGESTGHDWWHIYRVRKIAVERHRYMEQFPDKFFKEWDGKE